MDTGKWYKLLKHNDSIERERKDYKFSKETSTMADKALADWQAQKEIQVVQKRD